MILLINKINNLDNYLLYICLISGIVILTSGYIIYSKYSASIIISTPRTFDPTPDEIREFNGILETNRTSNFRLISPEELDATQGQLLQGITFNFTPDEDSEFDSILDTPQSSNTSLEELDEIQGITFDQVENNFEARLTIEELAEINELIEQGLILDEQTQNRLNEEFANIVGPQALNELQLLNENFQLVVENFFFNL